MKKSISIIGLIFLLGFTTEGFSCDEYAAQVSGLNISNKEAINTGNIRSCHLTVTVGQDFTITSGKDCRLVYEEITRHGVTIFSTCDNVSNHLLETGNILTTNCDGKADICLD